MKIGILTFHRAHNYGAVLQAFALQEYFKMCGHETFIIDYRQSFIERIYKCFSVRRCVAKNPLLILRKTLNELYNYKKRVKKKKFFESFCNEYLQLTESIVNPNDIPGDFDAYVHGSDQIWNSKLLGGYDLIYFGDYKTCKKAIKVSYAASMEFKHLSLDDKNAIKKGLSFLDYISVRENKLIPILQPFTNKPIKNVIDPTLLANSIIWETMCQHKIEEEYILTYKIGEKTKVDNYANLLSEKLGINILSVNKMNLSPNEFVRYIKYAKYIISDSFHATVFSILFKKQFYTVASGTGSDIRFTEILEALGLKTRILKYSNEINYNKIDYTRLNIAHKLELYRAKSRDFIAKALRHENN